MGSAGKPPKSYHHGDLRAALIDAAVELINEHGTQGLSLRECARHAGVSHAAPYRHFRDKDALLVAIAQQGFERLWAAGVAAMEAVDDPAERLIAYGVAYVRHAVEQPAHHRVMFTTVHETKRDPEGPGQQAFDLLVDAAKAAAGPNADPQEAALAAWSLPHGLSMLILDGRVPAEFVSTPEAAETLARAAFGHWRNMLAR